VQLVEVGEVDVDECVHIDDDCLEDWAVLVRGVRTGSTVAVGSR
jgi:hypothetical protein